MIYREWNYDSGEVVTYRRIGECNGCGQCCIDVIRFAVANNTVRGFPDDMRWNARNGEPVKNSVGRFIEVEHNGKHRYFYGVTVTGKQDRCDMLTDDNKCRIHTGKSLLSKAWPMIPQHVQAFDKCSYEFEETERRAIRQGE